MICVWSPKGGQGLSVTVAAMALAHRRRGDATVAVVDLAGDQPVVLGVEGCGAVGVLDWLGSRATPQALGRTALEVVDGLTLIPRGGGPPSVRCQPADVPDAARPARVSELWAAIDDLADVVLVDAGVPASAPASTAEQPGAGTWGVGLTGRAEPAAGVVPLQGGGELGRLAVRAATHNVVVVRACYLAMRRFGRLDLAADAIVFLREPWRALVAGDLEISIGAPVLATVEVDPAVARAADSGQLALRLPRPLERQVADVVPAVCRIATAFGGAA